MQEIVPLGLAHGEYTIEFDEQESNVSWEGESHRGVVTADWARTSMDTNFGARDE